MHNIAIFWAHWETLHRFTEQQTDDKWKYYFLAVSAQNSLLTLFIFNLKEIKTEVSLLSIWVNINQLAA